MRYWKVFKSDEICGGKKFEVVKCIKLIFISDNFFFFGGIF